MMRVTATTKLAKCGILASLLILLTPALAQQEIIPVWPGVAPGSEDWTQTEVQYLNDQKEQMVRNVVALTLTVFRPEPSMSNGTAMIVAPGGGNLFLSWQTEGTDVAEWLAERGVTAFLLKYRLRETAADTEEFGKELAALFARIRSMGTGNRPAESNREPADSPSEARPSSAEQEPPRPTYAVDDGRQAVRVVRGRAAEFGISPDRIGIMGFSAGAAVTMGPVMNHDEDSRPNFAAPIYGGGTNGLPIPTDAPPLFILAAGNDPIAAGSPSLYSAWKAAGHEAELHLYSTGGHGFGMRKQGLPIDTWIDRLGDWLAVQGLLEPAAANVPIEGR